MKQVVLNLLSNAITYAPGGQVRVSAIGDGCSVQLEVSDNGLGMTASEIGVALEPFGQIQRQYLISRSGGSGLGLPIAKSLAELNGARFELTSTLGAGTSVRVWLPAMLT
jgi:signal transduction histidine kinase